MTQIENLRALIAQVKEQLTMLAIKVDQLEKVKAKPIHILYAEQDISNCFKTLGELQHQLSIYYRINCVETKLEMCVN